MARGDQAALQLVPVTRDQAMDFIRSHHRHSRRPQGYRFAVGVARDTKLIGVATAGRPVARALDDGNTIEVTRVCTDGTPHACSMLYGACWRAAKAMGYRRAVTYTLTTESGASLRAAGWTRVAELRARPGWDTPSRNREANGSELIPRQRWEVSARADGGSENPDAPCGSCDGQRWVDDENWQPDPDDIRDRIPIVRTAGNGRIPCGGCNHGDWNEPDGGSDG